MAMERKIPLSSNHLDTPAISNERELRALDPSVCRAYLEGETFVRYTNPDKSAGGWLSEKAEAGRNLYLGPGAIVFGTKIGDNVAIGSGATVRNSNIQYGTIVGAGTSVRNSMVFGDCEIGDGVDIESSFIGAEACVGDRARIGRSDVRKGARIGCGVSLRKAALLGDNRIGEGSSITNSMVFARMEVGERSFVENSRIELTKAGKLPAGSRIENDIVHSDLDVVGIGSNLIDPPEDLLPVRSYPIEEMVDRALGIKRK
jgi:carbonic anhydrase/acetyltransferase-like protein (isoleucine patch superfamily)